MFFVDNGGCCGGRGNAQGFFIMLTMVFIYAPLFVNAYYGILANYDKYRSLYASWLIQIDRDCFVIHRHYNGDSETTTYNRKDIHKLRRNESTDTFPSPLLGRFPSLLCNEGRGGLELILRDGTVEFLPSLPQPPNTQQNRRYDDERSSRLVNYLNHWLKT
jgi:hypothetical protein